MQSIELHNSGKCDFCSTGTPKWRYPCRDFTMRAEGFNWGSRGDFAACIYCANLIEEDKRRALAMFSLAHYGHLPNPDAREYVLRSIRRMHDKFFENRVGPRIACY